MKILVSGLYRDPSTNDNPRTITYLAVCDNITEALDFVREHFDGQDTFDNIHVPRIIEHFQESEEEYYLDDWSAGQWFYFIKSGKTFEKVSEIQ